MKGLHFWALVLSFNQTLNFSSEIQMAIYFENLFDML